MAEVTETLLNLKLERSSYSRNDNVDNFAEEKELVVTITLAEYRNLIASNAIAEERVKAANDGKYARETENANLKNRVAELEGIIKMMSNNKTNEGETDESI